MWEEHCARGFVQSHFFNLPDNVPRYLPHFPDKEARLRTLKGLAQGTQPLVAELRVSLRLITKLILPSGKMPQQSGLPCAQRQFLMGRPERASWRRWHQS